MKQDESDKTHKKHINAYNTMLARIKSFFDEAEKEISPKLHHGIQSAKDKATKLGELTHAEAEKVSEFLKRDIEHAAEYLSTTGKELSDWLKFDIALLEDRLVDLLALVADQTKVELDQLAEKSAAIGEWHTGEIISAGTLQCKKCEKNLHFHKTSHIPPCPGCHHTHFQRLTK